MAHSKENIVHFQKLYLHYYGKNLTMEEAEKRLTALVNLLRLVRDVSQKETAPIKLEFNIKK